MGNSYPTFYKLAYATGKESSIPAFIRNRIPKQTKSNWRNLTQSEIQKIMKDEYAIGEYKIFNQNDAFDQLVNRRLFSGF